MFIQSCFVRKNTKELREKIKNLGYKLNHGKAWGKYLACFRTPDTNEDVFVASPNWDLENMPNFKNAIDCGTNEELFLAIAALCDDSDYMQWFVTDAEQVWVNQEIYAKKGNFFLCLVKSRYPECWKGYEEFCSFIVPAHKATVRELIEHFKL
jgi:hypothetical protein